MSGTGFDQETYEQYRRGYEDWDLEALLELYADDVEVTQLDSASPPGSPRVRRGKRELREMLRALAAAEAKIGVSQPVLGGGRGAATLMCTFPSGRRIVANVILEWRDGRIARELRVQSMDE